MIKKNVIFLLAGIALFVAMAQLPYGYYQLLRFFIFGVSLYSVSLNHEEKNTKWVWIFGSIAILFNPFFKVHFEKELWSIIDLITGLLFCFYFVIRIKKKKAG